MKQVPDVLTRNEGFINQVEAIDPAYFTRISEEQHPNCFVLACSDSRVSPSVVTQSPLGFLFVHRNIANQVVLGDSSFEAGLYYALKHLKVKKVIVKGHTGCGGITAAKAGNEEPYLYPWLKHITEGLSEHLGDGKDVSIENLAQLNVIAQVERLANHPVYKTHGAGVPIEGYVFHLETGRLELVIRQDPVGKELSYSTGPA